MPQTISCNFSQLQIETIRSNARAYLQERFGDGYVVHGSEWAVTETVQESQGACGLRILPMGVSVNPTDFLRGEGFVYFDTMTLKPISLAYFLE